MKTETGTERIYRHHHGTKRGTDFVLLGDVRGQFLAQHVGKGKKVLDIGCRDGALTAHFAEGNDVVGADIDQEALARATEQLGITTMHVDLNGPWDEIPKSHFDVVVAAEVIEHLYYPDLVFEKIAAVLKPGGVVLGSVPNAFSLKNRVRLLMGRKRNTPLHDPTHINHFTYDELQGLLSRSFEESTVSGIGRFTLARHFPGLFAYGFLFRGTKK